MTALTVTPRNFNIQKIIAGIFIVACSLLIVTIVATVVFITSMLIANFGLELAGTFALYAGLANVLTVMLTLLTSIWGTILFVRYIRLFQNKLKISIKRLWIETIALNVLNLFLVYFVQELTLPYSVMLVVGIWIGLAMLLAGVALLLRMRQAV